MSKLYITLFDYHLHVFVIHISPMKILNNDYWSENHRCNYTEKYITITFYSICHKISSRYFMNSLKLPAHSSQNSNSPPDQLAGERVSGASRCSNKFFHPRSRYIVVKGRMNFVTLKKLSWG